MLELVSRGHQVTLFARNPHRVPALAESTSLAYVTGELADLERIRDHLSGHDACIHNAVWWSDDDDEDGSRDLAASKAIFSAALESGVKRILYTSSRAVHRPFRPLTDENSPLAPTEPYGLTKARAEEFLFDLSRTSTVRCNAIRVAPTIGRPIEGTAVNCDRHFHQFIAAARRGEDIVVAKNDGRQFVAAPDIAKLYAAVLASDQRGQAFLGVSDVFTTWEDVAIRIRNAVGSKSRVIAEDQDLPLPPHCFDAQKIRRAFNLQFGVEPHLTEHIRYLVSRPSILD